MNIPGVGEMGVGEMGQIIGETGVGEMGVGETGTSRLFLTGILHETDSSSLKVSFELNSINLELSYYFPGSQTRHDSENQTRFRL